MGKCQPLKKNGSIQQQHGKNRRKNDRHSVNTNNWIENCSESAHRVLQKEFVAPLLCLITRAEIDENEAGIGDPEENEMRKSQRLLPLPSEEFVDHDHSDVNSAVVDITGSNNYHGVTNLPSAKGCVASAIFASRPIDDVCNGANASFLLADKDVIETVPSSEKAYSSPDLISVINASSYQSTSNIAELSSGFFSRYTREKVPFHVPSTVRGDDSKDYKLFIPVKRHASAIGPTKWAQLQYGKGGGKRPRTTRYHHLPNGDNGDGICNPYSTSSVPNKFWAQRKRLFSRYDNGIQIGGEMARNGERDCDNPEPTSGPEMWYSVTPEAIANHIADRMVQLILSAQEKRHCNNDDATQRAANDTRSKKETKSIVILDPFCGCGGNSIAFARWNERRKFRNEMVGSCPHNDVDNNNLDQKSIDAPPLRVKVFAVENNLSRLKMAAHNASIYEVPQNDIVFIHADAVEVLNKYSHGSTIIDSRGCGNEGSARQHVSETHYAGYALGGVDLLPNRIDGIFLSPPWGGMSYVDSKGKSGFDPVSSIIVESSVSSVHDPPLGVEEGTASSIAKVSTNGGELLHIATKAVFNDTAQEGVVAYFLPRNIDGVILGKIAVGCDLHGCFEMEQNVVNGKVKTVTAYFSHGINEKNNGE